MTLAISKHTENAMVVVERVFDDRSRYRQALCELIDAATSMPDAGLDDSDPRRAWWFNVLAPARDRALQALGF